MAVVRLSKRTWEQLKSKEFRSYLLRLVLIKQYWMGEKSDNMKVKRDTIRDNNNLYEWNLYWCSPWFAHTTRICYFHSTVSAFCYAFASNDFSSLTYLPNKSTFGAQVMNMNVPCCSRMHPSSHSCKLGCAHGRTCWYEERLRNY